MERQLKNYERHEHFAGIITSHVFVTWYVKMTDGHQKYFERHRDMLTQLSNGIDST